MGGGGVPRRLPRGITSVSPPPLPLPRGSMKMVDAQGRLLCDLDGR